jgi:TnpA family transposase
VPGTSRDSLFILDALLNLDGAVKPEMVATDHASYSDMVFGLFKILGYRFSPRLRDLSDQRFWRAEAPGEEASDYGPLNAVARNKVNLGKIETHWPDMLRVAGSLITNQVRHLCPGGPTGAAQQYGGGLSACPRHDVARPSARDRHGRA